jgi:P2 family phage contractile tail tube protein
MLPLKLKNMNLFIDDRGLAGRVTEVSLPKVTAKLEEFRAGGMDSPVKFDMGLEALEASFTLAEYSPDVLKLFGLTLGNTTPVTIRGYAEDEQGRSQAIVVHLRGRLNEMDMGSWKPGDNAELKGTISCTYYRLKINGRDIIEVDTLNMVRKIGGVDQLLLQRLALGI